MNASPKPQVGDQVEDFELRDDHGQTWRLTDQRGRPLLLIFHRHLL